MGLPESYFWESTPRKIIALIDQKKEITKEIQKSQAVYIACCIAGKDFKEIEKSTESNGLIAGRDIPIDPMALNSLMM